MPRRPRIHLPGLPLHIVQRGHNRDACFFAEEDFQAYRHWLGTYLGGERRGAPLHVLPARGRAGQFQHGRRGGARGLLTMEFVKAAEHYPLSYADLKDLARDDGQLRPEFAEVRGPIWQVAPAQEALFAKD